VQKLQRVLPRDLARISNVREVEAGRSACSRRKQAGRNLAPLLHMSVDSHFVYVLRSTIDRSRYYVGLTTDVDRRIAVHNSGGSVHSATNRPWEFVASIEFSNPASALDFEKYLKSGSGRAFAKRHFV
jgi:putative endonuclease